jgi:hypothetical protein
MIQNKTVIKKNNVGKPQGSQRHLTQIKNPCEITCILYMHRNFLQIGLK